MEDIDSNEFGGVDKDVEGKVDTITVQKRGRVNIPDKFLTYIGCEAQDQLIVVAEDGEVKLKKASADNVMMKAFAQGLELLNGGD